MYIMIKRSKCFKIIFHSLIKTYNVSAMKMHKMATKVGGIVRGVFTELLYLKLKLISLNVIKMLLVVLGKQLLKILLNALLQHQDNLNIMKNAQNQLNLHKLENLN